MTPTPDMIERGAFPRLEVGYIVDGSGEEIAEEAMVFDSTNGDFSIEIRVSGAGANANRIAERIVRLWNAAPPADVEG